MDKNGIFQRERYLRKKFGMTIEQFIKEKLLNQSEANLLETFQKFNCDDLNALIHDFIVPCSIVFTSNKSVTKALVYDDAYFQELINVINESRDAINLDDIESTYDEINDFIEYTKEMIALANILIDMASDLNEFEKIELLKTEEYYEYSLYESQAKIKAYEFLIKYYNN